MDDRGLMLVRVSDLMIVSHHPSRWRGSALDAGVKVSMVLSARGPSVSEMVASTVFGGRRRGMLRGSGEVAFHPVRTESTEEDDPRTLVRAFESAGGIVSGDELAARIRPAVLQPISILARAIVCRRVVSFSCFGMTLLPLFQFEAETIEVRERVRRIVGELVGVFDEHELAAWFARANSSLGGRAPVQAVDVDPAAVLQAARVDRFIVKG